jgi:hypothetical protein
LVTASEQGCFVWDIKTRQCLSKFQGRFTSCQIVFKSLCDLPELEVSVLKRFQEEIEAQSSVTAQNTLNLESEKGLGGEFGSDTKRIMGVFKELDSQGNALQKLLIHNRKLRELNDTLFSKVLK